MREIQETTCWKKRWVKAMEKNREQGFLYSKKATLAVASFHCMKLSKGLAYLGRSEVIAATDLSPSPSNNCSLFFIDCFKRHLKITYLT